MLVISSIISIIGYVFLDQIGAYYGRGLIIGFYAGCYSNWEIAEWFFDIWKQLVGIHTSNGNWLSVR